MRLSLCLLMVTGSTLAQVPETVRFFSEDGKTKLVGFLFLPITHGVHPGATVSALGICGFRDHNSAIEVTS